MKRLRSGVQPITQGTAFANHTIQRRDRHLLVLAIAQVIVYVISTVLFPAILLEMVITQYVTPMKSLYQIRVEIFVLNSLIYFKCFTLLYLHDFICIVSSRLLSTDAQLLLKTTQTIR